MLDKPQAYRSRPEHTLVPRHLAPAPQKPPYEAALGPGSYEPDPLGERATASLQVAPGEVHHTVQYARDPTRPSAVFVSAERCAGRAGGSGAAQARSRAEHHPCHELHRVSPCAVAHTCQGVGSAVCRLDSQKHARVWGPHSGPKSPIPLCHLPHRPVSRSQLRGRTARDVAEAAAQPPISSRMTDPDWGHWTSKGCWLPRSERSVEADRWGPTARERRPPADERPDR